nr:UxaA family hydrolase [Roseomonas acroporae]
MRLDPRDNVLVARHDLTAGSAIPAEGITLAEAVPAAHKLVARPVAAGAPVLRGGVAIGLAARELAPGTLLCPGDLLPAAPPPARAAVPPAPLPAAGRATFQGFVRADGRVGTRNTIAVIVLVNCAATAARQAADWFDAERLAAFPNVDAVVPYIHETGCGMEATGEPMDLLRRTIAGTIRHPNTFGAVVLSLGCERNNLQAFLAAEKLAVGDRLQTVTIQEAGGIRATVETARAMVAAMLPAADRARRETVSAEHLVLGLQTAAPDGFTGISANPALGAAVDLLLRHGGTAILSETPDALLAGPALAERAATPEVAAALAERFGWWRDATRGRDTPLEGRLDRRHARAGLASVLEKALDGIGKAGTAPLAAACRYAEPVTARGLVFMDTPDDDPVSVTGQIAGGANLIAMTTGLGTGFGSQPAPTVKIAASGETFARLADDIDLDAGPVLDGALSAEAMGARIFEALLRHASGERTKGEVEGMGENEYVPWPIGVTG